MLEAPRLSVLSWFDSAIIWIDASFMPFALIDCRNEDYLA